MVNSSKVLTVSYGTFSCTLEGFDDSFEMMKAIAEYFRDLAADDRYFGAEPPTPDAEMLARIAEREIERRVEARLEKGNIVLRPSLAQQRDAVPAPAADLATRTPDDAAMSDAEDVAPAAATADDETGAAAGAGTTEPAVDRTGGTASAGAAKPAATTGDAATRREAATAAPEARNVLRVQPGRTLVIKPAKPRPSAAPAPAPQPAAAAHPEPQPERAQQVAKPATAETAASVADKLKRIRAVVAANDTVDQGFVEDQHADVLGDEVDDDADLASISAVLAEQSGGAAAADAAQAVDEDSDAHDAIDFGDILAEADDADEPDAPMRAEDAGEDEEALDLDALLGSLDLEEEDLEDALQETHDGSDRDERPQWDTVDAVGFDDEDEDDDLEFDDGFDDATPAPAPKVELRRVKRAALEEPAKAGDAAPEVAHDRLRAPLADTSSLDDEDEDDLARELAQLEAEIAEAEAELATGADGEDEDDWEDDLETAWEEDAPEAGADGWDEDDEDIDEPQTAPSPEEAPRAASAPEEDEWDDYDEEDAEEDRKWAEAEARIKAEQAARAAAADAEPEAVSEPGANRGAADDAARRDLDEMEATIDRLARESVRKTVKMTSPARVMLTESRVEESDTSVSRLMHQTDEELSEPEGNRRRSAIAHLRAAVAATRADRILGRKRDEEKEKAAYQEDLEDVVRPRRPKAGEGRSERPQPRPAPLKLVAEQRVDAARETPRAPAPARVEAVRPRRPTTAMIDDDLDDDDDSFAEFARKVGARELPELLEAAAAYMAFVEGRDQFSRPQLMSKVRQAEASESSREDRLRSFGQLLREGKIQKTRGGRFTASEDIGFRPRAAG